MSEPQKDRRCIRGYGSARSAGPHRVNTQRNLKQQGGNLRVPGERKRILADSGCGREFPVAQATDGRGRGDAHHHFKRTSGARAAQVFPASRESSCDIEGRERGAASAPHEFERRWHGGAHGETAETRCRAGPGIRVVDGSAHQRPGPGGLGELGRNGGNSPANAARKRERTPGRGACGTRATRLKKGAARGVSQYHDATRSSGADTFSQWLAGGPRITV